MDPFNRWLSLPEHIWIQIMENLDVKSLLATTETCETLAKVFADSTDLMARIKFKLLAHNKNEMTSQLQVMTKSNRNYQSLRIGLTYEEQLKLENLPGDVPDLEIIESIFGHTVTSLEMIHLSWHQSEFIEFLTLFKNLTSLSLYCVLAKNLYRCRYLYKTPELQEEIEVHSNNFINLTELSISQTSNFTFYLFKNSLKLRKLVVDGPGYETIDMVMFEDYLQKLSDLKELQLSNFQYSSLFFNNTEFCQSPPFQLESLTIDSIYWKNMDNAVAFLTSQRQLKSLKLHLVTKDFDLEMRVMMFTYVLQHIFKFNNQLENLIISTKERYSFSLWYSEPFQNILCPKVKSLKYVKGILDETLATMEAFVEMFPNVENLTYVSNSKSCGRDLELISSWKLLKSLTIFVSVENLDNVQVSSERLEKLHLELSIACDIEMTAAIRDSFKSFLTRHPTIINLSIKSWLFLDEKVNNEFTKQLCQLITSSLPNLEQFTISRFDIDSETLEIVYDSLRNLRVVKLTTQPNSYDRIKQTCDNHQVKLVLREERKIWSLMFTE